MKRFLLKAIVMATMCALAASFMVLPSSAAEAVVTTDHAISFTGDELSDPIDGMWQGVRENTDTQSVESFNGGISGDGKSLKLGGYQSGGNIQYAYTDPAEFHNKIIKTKMVMEGEFVDVDASFIAFVFRAEGYSTKFFWDTSSYSIIIKGKKIEVQKHPGQVQGVDNNLGGEKGRTPIVVEMDTPFKPGTTYDIEMGVLDGKSPKTGKDSVNIIFRLNGKEYVNIWDDSERTPYLSKPGYFMVAPVYLQADVQDDEASKESHSGVTLLQVAAAETTTKATTTATKATTTKAAPAATTTSRVGGQTTTEAISDNPTTETPETGETEETAETEPSEEATEPADETTAPAATTGTGAAVPAETEPSGLSTGAIVGIIIAAVVVIGGGILLYVFVIRKKMIQGV